MLGAVIWPSPIFVAVRAASRRPTWIVVSFSITPAVIRVTCGGAPPAMMSAPFSTSPTTTDVTGPVRLIPSPVRFAFGAAMDFNSPPGHRAERDPTVGRERALGHGHGQDRREDIGPGQLDQLEGPAAVPIRVGQVHLGRAAPGQPDVHHVPVIVEE